MSLDVVGWLLPVIAFAVAMSATPGPNNIMLAASGATFGFAPTVPHMLGVAIGFPVMVGAIAAGAGGALHTWPWLQQVLRWVGAAYMVWLAWHIAFAAEGAATPRQSRPLGFIQAALFQWVNPKAWVIAAGGVVTYTSGSGRAFAGQVAALSLVLLVATAACVAIWTGIGAGTGRLLHTARARQRFNFAMAGLLLASLVPMLVE